MDKGLIKSANLIDRSINNANGKTYFLIIIILNLMILFFVYNN